MKDRIIVPEGLKNRVDGLVRHHAKVLRTSEADARRTVEIAILQQGIDVLERRASDEVSG